jgi:predicted adenylyl cyclase CyaB
MAQNNTEVEIKLELSKEEFEKVKEKLSKIAKHEKTTHQVDEYFTPIHRNFMAEKRPYEWLRIGRRGEKSIITYKHYHKDEHDIYTHCDEYETEVKDKKQLELIFKAINITPIVIVDKTREDYNYKDELVASLDTIKDLGHYIELEAIKNEGTIEEIRTKLFHFAKKIGIDSPKHINAGYPFILMKKKGLI